MRQGILIFFIGVGLFAFQQGNSAFATELTDDYFDIATNYYTSNNYAKAIEYLDEILNLEPENLEAKALKEKISPPPDSTTSAQAENTAKLLSVLPDPQNFVILDMPQADVEKMNYNSDYYNTKGQEFYQKQEYNTAVEYFYKSINLNSRNAQACNNLAMAYWQKNSKELAIQYFKKANALNRNYTQPLVNLSILYGQLGNEIKQFYYLKKATYYNPNDYWAYYLLGDYYKAKSCYPEAITNLKEAIKINQKFSQAYLSLALCFFETEEFNYALTTLNQYRELNPSSDFAIFMMARTNLALCHYDKAKSYILEAIAINDTTEYQFELAKTEYYLENYQTALDIFQQVLQTSVTAEAFNYVGLCNYKLKNIEVAIANFNKAIDLDGLRPIYYYNLAQCYKSLGDKKNYLKYVNTATKITPINYQDFIDLSYIYYDNGNPNYAINALNDATKKYPNIKSLYLSKLKIYESLNDNAHYNQLKDLINERFNERINTNEKKT
jgi:tetratricopeptide (TPR) repeat protein